MPSGQYLFFQLIKFTKPEYKDYVCATLQRDLQGDSLETLPPRACEHLVLGETPYIDLGGGYVLTHWWAGEIVSINPIYMPVLLNCTWRDLPSYNYRWAFDSSLIVTERPFEELYIGSSRQIDGYYNVCLQNFLQSGTCQIYDADSVLQYDYKYSWDGSVECAMKEETPDLYNHLVWVGEQYEEMIIRLFHSGEYKNIFCDQSNIKYTPMEELRSNYIHKP